VSDEEDGDARD